MTDEGSAAAAAAGRGHVELGPVGVWTSMPQWPADPGAIGAAGAELEELGFGAVWIGGSVGQFAPAAALLAATTRLVVATGVIEVWANPAQTVAVEHDRLAAAYPGRFLLGLGPGHAPAVEARGQRYERPLAKLSSYLDELDSARPPVPAGERVLAALGPRALALAGQRSAGAHPYNVTVEHTAIARAALGPGPLLAPEQKVYFSDDPADAREVARQKIARTLELPNYSNNLRRLGLDEQDFAGGGSDRLLDGLVAWGSPDKVAGRVRAHLDAGADHVCVQVLVGDGQPGLPLAEWRIAAAALLG
jgi:probable F420-dependent oxidoreductase